MSFVTASIMNSGKDAVSESPTGHRVALGEAVKDDGPIYHVVELGDGGVRTVVIHVLVDLVGKHDEVVLDGDLGDPLKVLVGYDAAARVVRRVDDDEFGVFGYQCF